MGWFGVSNSANRANNLESMRIDLNNATFLRNTTGQILASTDFQLGRASVLDSVVRNQPRSHQYSQNNISISAGELATELRFAIQDGQRFRAEIAELNTGIASGTEMIGRLLSEYNVPRGQRTVRFGPQNVPPSGKEIAVVSDNIAEECVSEATQFVNANSDGMVRAFAIIEKADNLVTGQVHSEHRPETYLRQLMNS